MSKDKKIDIFNFNQKMFHPLYKDYYTFITSNAPGKITRNEEIDFKIAFKAYLSVQAIGSLLAIEEYGTFNNPYSHIHTYGSETRRVFELYVDSKLIKMNAPTSYDIWYDYNEYLIFNEASTTSVYLYLKYNAINYSMHSQYRITNNILSGGLKSINLNDLRKLRKSILSNKNDKLEVNNIDICIDHLQKNKTFLKNHGSNRWTTNNLEKDVLDTKDIYLIDTFYKDVKNLNVLTHGSNMKSFVDNKFIDDLYKKTKHLLKIHYKLSSFIYNSLVLPYTKGKKINVSY